MLTTIKKVIFVVIPISITFYLDYSSNFRGWKELNLVIRKDVATATITENPFYKMVAVDGFDRESLPEYIIMEGLDDKARIKYKYMYDGIIVTDSLHYLHYVEEGINPEESGPSFIQYEFAEWANEYNLSKVGTNFKVYYYQNLSIPKRVIDNVQYEQGFFRLVMSSYLTLLILAISISIVILYVQFFRKAVQR